MPVCAAFREKIVGGQLCYQAHLGRHDGGVGLSLVIDTNQEYDVKNLLNRNRNTKIKDPKTFDAYPESEKESIFSILLGTISINLLYC